MVTERRIDTTPIRFDPEELAGITTRACLAVGRTIARKGAKAAPGDNGGHNAAVPEARFPVGRTVLPSDRRLREAQPAR